MRSWSEPLFVAHASILLEISWAHVSIICFSFLSLCILETTERTIIENSAVSNRNFHTSQISQSEKLEPVPHST